MKKYVLVLTVAALGAVLVAALGVAISAQPGQANPAIAKQLALEKTTPQLQVTEEVLQLDVPGQTIGETTGVAKNSQGHLFVFTRTGSANGPALGAAAARLFEFDQNLRFVKEWGPNNYALSFAHTVRVDRQDNVWISDEGANMVVKFNPQGRVAMVLGRKIEALDYMEEHVTRGEHDEERFTVGNMGTFNRPTDVTWDPQGNIFVSDGYNNSRVAKIAPDGTWVKSVGGERGSGQDQFSTPHGIAADAKGMIYVADRGNRRVQVYDSELNFQRSFENMGAPWTACVSPGPTQYLFTGDGNGKIYKLDLNGNLLGWAQTSLGHGQTGCLVHTLHCESETVLYKGDCSTWTVEKITITGGGRPPSQ